MDKPEMNLQDRIAFALVRWNYKENPLTNFKVYNELGDWNVSGVLSVADIGQFNIDFTIDECQKYFGFMTFDGWDCDFEFFDKRKGIRGWQAFVKDMEKHLKPFLEFLDKVKESLD